MGVTGLVLEWSPYQALDVVGRTTTDSAGRYSVSLPIADLYQVGEAQPVQTGLDAIVYVPPGQYRTDLITGTSECPIMSGFVFDASTSKPVADATVFWVDTNGVSGADGSYVVNLGCRNNGYGYGTSSWSVTHPAYKSQSGYDTRREFLIKGALFRRDFAIMPR
jgi:hypothetical protein